jgi:regulatory protein
MVDMEFDQPRKKKTLTAKEAKLKAADFCAYQERSQQQVRDKLYDYGLHMDEVEEVLSDLIIDGFLNEERFARAFVGGKFRMKQWGRHKILQGLQQHKISEYCIKAGLEEIEEEVYQETLKNLMIKKARSITAANDYDRRNKMARFAVGRGYETALIWEVIKQEGL